MVIITLSRLVIRSGHQQLMIIDEIDGVEENRVSVNWEGVVYDNFWFQEFVADTLKD